MPSRVPIERTHARELSVVDRRNVSAVSVDFLDTMIAQRSPCTAFACKRSLPEDFHSMEASGVTAHGCYGALHEGGLTSLVTGAPPQVDALKTCSLVQPDRHIEGPSSADLDHVVLAGQTRREHLVGPLAFHNASYRFVNFLHAAG